MARKFAILVLSLVLVFSFAAVSSAGNDISVVLNGETFYFDQAPVIEDGTTLVPVRAIFEKYNMIVNYNESTRTITAESAGSNISMVLNSNTAYVNGQPVTLRVAPKIIGDRTLIPLRFISESLGVAVEWDEYTRTIYLGSTAGSSTINGQINDALDAISQQPNIIKTVPLMPYNNPVIPHTTTIPSVPSMPTMPSIPNLPRF